MATLQTDIKIYNTSGGIVLTAPIGEGSKRIVKHMEDDHILLRFSLDEVKTVKRGYYCLVPSEKSGMGNERYVVTKPTFPTYNAETGGYDYELVMDAWYYTWKRFVLVLNPQYGAVQTSFSYTGTLDAHLKLIMTQLARLRTEGDYSVIMPTKVILHYNGLDVTYNSSMTETQRTSTTKVDENTNAFTFLIPGTVSGRTLSAEMRTVTYSDTDIISAIGQLCGEDAFNCEWWVEENGTMHFGRCEYGTAVTWNHQTEMQSLQRADSSDEYATKIVAFGSKTNVPARYRKSFKLQLTDFGVLNPGDSETIHGVLEDTTVEVAAPKQESGAYKGVCSRSLMVTIPDEIVKVSASSTIYLSVSALNDASKLFYVEVRALGKTETVLNEQDPSAASSSFQTNLTISTQDLEVYPGMQNAFPVVVMFQMLGQEGEVSTELMANVSTYIITDVHTKPTRTSEVCRLKDNARICAPTYFDNAMVGGGMFKAKLDASTHQLKDAVTGQVLDIDVYGGASVVMTPAVDDYTLRMTDADGKVYGFKGSGSTVTVANVPWLRGKMRICLPGSEDVSTIYNVTVVSKAAEVTGSFYKISTGASVCTDTLEASNTSEWFALGMTSTHKTELQQSGLGFKLSNVMDGNVPLSYWTDDYAVDEYVASCERRLMLPTSCAGNAIISGRAKSGSNVIRTEIVEVVKVYDDIYPSRTFSIANVDTWTETVTIIDDNGAQEYVQRTRYRFWLLKTDMVFKQAYISNGDTLRCRFQDGVLAGMQFDLEFDGNSKDGTMQGYKIMNDSSRNIDLPNGVLAPATGDKIVLLNYCPISLTDMGFITEAEARLKKRAMADLDKLSLDAATYTVTMASDKAEVVFTAGTGFPKIGQKMTLKHEAYFPSGRTTRVIGYEICLDIPYDKPVFTLGESLRYSRLNKIESSIKK